MLFARRPGDRELLAAEVHSRIDLQAVGDLANAVPTSLGDELPQPNEYFRPGHQTWDP
jgi:hypothetical protein